MVKSMTGRLADMQLPGIHFLLMNSTIFLNLTSEILHNQSLTAEVQLEQRQPEYRTHCVGCAGKIHVAVVRHNRGYRQSHPYQ